MLGITIETQQVAAYTAAFKLICLTHFSYHCHRLSRYTCLCVCECCAVKRLFVADYCGAFVSLVSLLLTEGGKNSSALCFDHTLEQLHTDRGRGSGERDGVMEK